MVSSPTDPIRCKGLGGTGCRGPRLGEARSREWSGFCSSTTSRWCSGACSGWSAASTRDWEVLSTSSPFEAVELLREHALDAVVSDMTMPGMDGAQLLKRVMREQPGAVRIVLSGGGEDVAILRAARVAHRFVSKPFRPAELESALTRSLALRAMVDQEGVREVLGGLTALPTLPATYAKLQQVLADPNRPPTSPTWSPRTWPPRSRCCSW